MKEKKKIMLMDMANLGIRTATACFRDDPTDTHYTKWKEKVLGSLVDLIQKTGADSAILCQEGKKNWRFDVYDKYKAHRKEEKAKSKMDFDTYYPMYDMFCDALRQYVPNIYQLKVNRAEGDDLIAVLTKNLTKNYEVICVSTDRDFYQLLKYEGYKQYHPIKRNFVQVANPERYLLEKIIVGDKNDGVPHVKPRVSFRTAPKIIDEGLDEWLKREGLQKEYERNKTLIDFDCIPVDVQDDIMTEFRNLRYSPMFKRDFNDFVNAIGCPQLIMNSPEYASTLCRMERIDAQ